MAKAPEDDYYVLLGIDAAADDDEVRRAWRRLALEWHPDRAGPGTTATFQRISVAYAVLSDPDARTAYDRWRDKTTASSRNPAAPTPVGPLGPRAPSIMLRRLSGHMNSLLARGIAHYAEGDVIELLLDDDEAAQGGMVTISMRVEVRCQACGGAGAGPCTTCGGEGAVEDLFAAWLAVRPGVADGTILTPSAWLPGMLHPVYFRVRLPG